MGRQQRIERAAMGKDPYKTAIIRLMREFSPSHDLHAVFSDFVEVSAIAISNRVDTARFEVREKRYLEIAAKYTRDELDRFAAMFAELHLCYRSRVDDLGDLGVADIPGHGLGDVLGEIFMALELGNAQNGQFFTPYSVSVLMAMIAIGDGASVKAQGFLTMQEPACGSGGMVVASAQALHQAGLAYPEALHATCVDVDRRCVHMAYVQLSLLGIAATVVHGNTLSLEVKDVWYTPAHILVGWNHRLRRRRDEKADARHLPEDSDSGAAPLRMPDPEVANAQQPDDADASPSPVPTLAIQTTTPDDVLQGEEGDVAVAVQSECELHSPDRSASLVELFEQVTHDKRSAVCEAVTIFDRIEQMTLF
ncbi:N-6 DNA methylase [Paraburkholderia sp. BCC1876]|uniref:N-6 DNA methylase n=1 Tax=Paraburkholderia sp. BCC1876 TaxID=2676303 RepID=UPI0015922695|nr:N-6 DNA methylase [Paraburkholderia sp. BCC1876]